MKKILMPLSLAAAAITAGACEPARRGIEPGTSPVSGPIALTADDTRIVIASEDHDELLIVDRARHEVRGRVAVGDAPTHLIIAGSRAIVTARYGHSVTVVDLDRAAVVRTIPVGAEPMGLVEVEAGVVAVALAGAGAVAVVDVEAGRVLQTIALGADDPRAVALLADGSLYVSHMAQGVFSRVDLDAGSARVVDVATANQFGARLIPEHLRSLTIDLAYDTVLVAHSQANADTVRAPIGDPGFADPGIVDGGCGYSGCPTELGAVVPGVTEVDPEGDVVIVPQHDTSSSGQPGCPECDVAALPVEPGFGTFAAAPPSVMNPFESRFAGVQLSNPTALALFDGGRGQLVVHMSTKNALLLRRHLKGTASDVIGVAPLGNGAAGVAVSHDGTTAFVWNQFDGAITEIALPQVADRQSATRFNDSTIADRAVDAEVAEFGLAPQVDSTSFVVADDVLDAAASLGRKMFHDATDVRISANGTVSCASCHPDGRTDGRTWQFTFGPRNTPQLGGDILDTAPFHWPGDVPTVAALNDMTVKPFMGGAGMTAADFEPITAFLGTIRQAPSVAVARGALSELEQRGKTVFESQATGCTSCHAGGDFTDNASHDIGSTADFRDIRAFQTPVLHGLHRSAPYFHDGRYKTLEDMVAGTILTDQMGTGSHLSDDDTAALVAYLKTL